MYVNVNMVVYVFAHSAGHCLALLSRQVDVYVSQSVGLWKRICMPVFAYLHPKAFPVCGVWFVVRVCVV